MAGSGQKWQEGIGVALTADDCAALLDHLALGPAHVMGHSLGGMISLRLASAHPEAVSTLTLAAAAPLRLERNVALFKALLAIRKSDAAPHIWLHALFPWLFAPAIYEVEGMVTQATAASLAYPYAQSTQAMAHQIAALDGYVPDALDAVCCPVQALLAADDLLLPVELARPTLGNVPTHVIAQAGHSIHWDAPDAVAAHLRRFTEETQT